MNQLQEAGDADVGSRIHGYSAGLEVGFNIWGGDDELFIKLYVNRLAIWIQSYARIYSPSCSKIDGRKIKPFHIKYTGYFSDL